MSWHRFKSVLRGLPDEIKRRFLGIKYRLDHKIVHQSVLYPGETITSLRDMLYDRFTLFPDLQKENGDESDASPTHDSGWVAGCYDSGRILTFDDNNWEMRSIMVDEKQNKKVVTAVFWGVGLGIMRRKWRKTHGHE